MEFHELALSRRIHQAKRVNAEPFHHAERPWNGPIGHNPHDHVKRLGHQRDEVPKRVMRRGGLRKSSIGLCLNRVNQIGKLDCILNKEDRNIIANQIEIAFRGVELHRKAPHITRQIG